MQKHTAIGTKFVQRTQAANAVYSATVNPSIPFDDTNPQSGEGVEIITCAITPKSTANRLSVQGCVWGSYSANVLGQVALFRDAGADALQVGSIFSPLDNIMPNLIDYDMAVPAAGAAITFKIRVGAHAAATFYHCGQAAARKFGGAMAATLIITEYKA